ncbi:MAG TPA: NAD(P)-dependent oxidoreductase [Solirubrobacteraceae bacterium]
MTVPEPITRVAFIGLGHMGGHMCRHVIAGGFSVTAYDSDPDALARTTADGARPAQCAADCVRDAEILLTSLPGPPQVEAVLCGPEGAIAAMAPGSLVVDMSTSSLEVGRRARAEAVAAGVALLDAPVAGQTIGAEAGTLAIYAGGEPDAFARALPVLETMGDPQRIFLLGPGGCGYAVKLLLNLTWFIQAVATAEALTMGVKAGVDLRRLHTALVASPANSVFLERDVLPLLERGDYDDGFAMKLVTKDLGLAVDLARDVGVPVELSPLVEQIHRRARAAYGDEAGEMSAVRLYEDLAGVELRWPT